MIYCFCTARLLAGVSPEDFLSPVAVTIKCTPATLHYRSGHQFSLNISQFCLRTPFFTSSNFDYPRSNRFSYSLKIYSSACFFFRVASVANNLLPLLSFHRKVYRSSSIILITSCFASNSDPHVDDSTAVFCRFENQTIGPRLALNKNLRM